MLLPLKEANSFKTISAECVLTLSYCKGTATAPPSFLLQATSLGQCPLPVLRTLQIVTLIYCIINITEKKCSLQTLNRTVKEGKVHC